MKGQDWVIPEIKGLNHIGREASPSLPARTYSFVAPLQSNDFKISDIQFSNITPIEGSYDVAPVMKDLPYNEDYEEDKLFPPYPKDIKIKPGVEIVHVENFIDLFRIVTVEVCPMSYDASTGSLAVYSDVRFSIDYSETNNQQLEQAHNKALLRLEFESVQEYIETIRGLVENENDIQDILYAGMVPGGPLPGDPGLLNGNNEAYQYTIITSQQLAPAFRRLVTLKKMRGINAGIIFIEDILSNPEYAAGDTISGLNDDAGKLRSYLMKYSHVIEYVLLGGKPPVVPIRYSIEGIPTDLYFGSPSDSNWANNMQFPKPHFNYSSIFRIGRLLCKTTDEVNNYLDKLEIYELYPGFGQEDYLKNAYTNISRALTSYYNQVNGQNNVINRMYSAIDSVYNNHINYDDCSSIPNYTGNDIISTINANQWGIMNIHGHGHPGCIGAIDGEAVPCQTAIVPITGEAIYVENETNNGLDKIENIGFPNIMLATSCSTAAFDSPKYLGYGSFNAKYDSLTLNMAESFTMGKNYGGVGYLGYTRNIGSDFAGDGSVYFFNMLCSSGKHELGRIKNDLLARLRIAHHNDGGYLKMLCLVGDPALNMWKGNDSIYHVPNYAVARTDSTVRVSIPLRGHSSSNYIVYIEPNGRLHKTSFGTISRFTNVDPNGILVVANDYGIPFISNLSVSKDATFTDSQYIYANKVFLGTNANQNDNPVNFESQQFTISALDDVRLGANLIIRVY